MKLIYILTSTSGRRILTCVYSHFGMRRAASYLDIRAKAQDSEDFATLLREAHARLMEAR